MTRLEAAQSAMIEAKIRAGDHDRFEVEGLTWCLSRRIAGVNVAWNPSLQKGEVSAAVEEVLNSARLRQSSLDFLIFPSSQPSDLPLRLRREWRLMGPMYLPGMTRSLKGTLPEPSHPTCEVTEWSQPVKEGHPLQRWTPKAQKRDWWLLHAQLAQEGRLFLVEACHEGAPAACACLFPHEGHALITSVLTLPELRGRGLGKSVMASALRCAATLECDEAGLLTHKRAKAFYESMGFAEEGMFSSHYYSKTRALKESSSSAGSP